MSIADAAARGELSGGRAFRFEYCCWMGRRWAGGCFALSIADAAARGETSGGRAFRFEYCCWRGRRWANGRFALSIATGEGETPGGLAGVSLEYCCCCCWRRDVGRAGVYLYHVFVSRLCTASSVTVLACGRFTDSVCGRAVAGGAIRGLIR